jgi:uncharacterized integral membrane protein
MEKPILEYGGSIQHEVVRRPFSQFVYWIAFIVGIIALMIVVLAVQRATAVPERSAPGTWPALPPASVILGGLGALVFGFLGAILSLVYGIVRLVARNITDETRWMAYVSVISGVAFFLAIVAFFSVR